MRLAPREALTRRLARLRGLLAGASLDALLVSHLPNVFYLTNFTGSAAEVVVAADHVYFITDFRYSAAIDTLLASEWGPPDTTPVIVEVSYDQSLADLLGRLGLARVGFESAHLTVKRHDWLRRALRLDDAEPPPAEGRARPELVSTERLVERLRIIKDRHELRVLREAAARLSEVAVEALREARSGRKEREIALAIDHRLRRAGFERTAFETIVASGPHSALPHARPGDRTLTAGDLVVVDFGGVLQNYCVDLTRTVSVGHPDRRAAELYEAVLSAQQAAIRAVRPGAVTHDVDAAAREALGAVGLAAAFGHGTGHGLGIEVHEEPRIGRRTQPPSPADSRLEQGMVFTIEPGAYLPEFGGVRIEDDVVVGEAGAEVLTQVPRELLIV